MTGKRKQYALTLVGIVLGLVVCCWPSDGLAQGLTANERSVARDQFRSGLAAAQRGEWDAARDAFRASYQLVPRQTTLLNLAGALAQTGQLVEGAEAYRQFLREAESGRQARRRAAAEEALEALVARIPVVRLRVRGLGRDDALTLDGWDVSTALVGTDVPVDPGDHVLVIFRERHEPLEVRFAAEEGSSQVVEADARTEVWPANELELEPRDDLDLTTTARRRPDTDDSLLESPLFWLVTGLVVAGGVTAGVLVISSEGRDPTMGNLPPYRVGVE